MVRVDVAPELKGRIQPGDTLFVFARMPEGPRMPLAIQRRQADSLPITVTLDDSMGMLPTMKLSSSPQVVVGARISRSGNATPQSGDFQGLSAPLAVAGQDGVVDLIIASFPESDAVPRVGAASAATDARVAAEAALQATSSRLWFPAAIGYKFPPRTNRHDACPRRAITSCPPPSR